MYRVVVDDEVVAQVAALPVEALRPYAEVLDVLHLVPADGDPYNADRPDQPMRTWTFGPLGQGMLIYLLLEDRQEVHLLQVQWWGSG